MTRPGFAQAVMKKATETVSVAFLNSCAAWILDFNRAYSLHEGLQNYRGR